MENILYTSDDNKDEHQNNDVPHIEKRRRSFTSRKQLGNFHRVYKNNVHFRDLKNRKEYQNSKKSLSSSHNPGSSMFYREISKDTSCKYKNIPRINNPKSKTDYSADVKKSDCVNPNELDQRDSMIWQFSRNKYECMICMSIIRYDSPVWSCSGCYHVFHMFCVKKWGTKCGDPLNEPEERSINFGVRCPACQKHHDLSDLCPSSAARATSVMSLQLPYRCWCGKQKNPAPRRGASVPHSCDGICEKPLADSVKAGLKTAGELCSHTCRLLCHPGPCPPCDFLVTRNCHCGQSRLTTKCSADDRTVVCGQPCLGSLNCGVHRCQGNCHAGECEPCAVKIDQVCYCDRKTVRSIICGEERGDFECGEECGRVLDCGNHQCKRVCHHGDCAKCDSTPELINRCWCNKKSQEELGNKRLSCLDPVKGCGDLCDRELELCGHRCGRDCHQGDCEPCPLSRNVPCRCGKSIIPEVPCASLENESAAPMCKSICRKKLLCGRHTCDDRCCVDEVHWCPRQCGRLLSCEQHRCKRECGHVGQCPVCDNVSFEELRCHCGLEVILPPIACGVPKPRCSRQCARDHPCNHPVRHNCHSDATCPPCTELTSKACPGDHVMMDNIPCFRSVVTCGRPCGRPLEGCEHLCVRNCHQDDCKDNQAACSQPCQKPRSDCGHPCGAPCHPRIDCEKVIGPCSSPIDLACRCGLRSIRLPCSESDSVSSEIESSFLKCIETCTKAVSLSHRLDRIRLPASQLIFQRYFAAFFENFCRENFNFVVSVEKIFTGFQDEKSEKCHKFYSVPLEKAKFINRYSGVYNISSHIVIDFQSNTAHVTVYARGCITVPKSILSKLVEEKYFKIFKPIF